MNSFIRRLAFGAFYAGMALSVPLTVHKSAYAVEQQEQLEQVILDDTLYESPFTGECGDNLTWVLTDDGTLTVSGTGEMSWTNWNAEAVRKVIIEPGVTSIHQNAFSGCVNLTSIDIPESVTRIGESAFWKCESLTSITLPSHLTQIDMEAFALCENLQSITIPASVTQIGYNLFQGCTSLKSLQLQNPDLRFDALPKGVRITTPDGTCGDHLTWSLRDGVLTISGTGEMYDYEYHFDGIVFYYGPFIWRYAQKLMIQNGVTSIGINAFRDCDRLEEVTIPSSVRTIKWDDEYHAYSPFYGCDEIRQVVSDCPEDFDAPKSAQVTIRNGRCGDNISWSMERDVLTITGSGVMKNYTGDENHPKWWKRAREVRFEEGITFIGESAFTFCPKLESISIPSTVRIIGKKAFYECSALQKLIIPGTVNSIGDFAFSDCTGLTDLTIENGVKSIESGAFSRCNSLTEVTIPGTVEKCNGFNYCDRLASVALQEGVGEANFTECKSLTTLSLPQTLTSLNVASCVSLKDLNLPASIRYLNASNCDSLQSLTIPAGAKPSGVYVNDCDQLTSLVFQNGTKSIYSNFKQNPRLTSITIPDSVTYISENAFKLDEYEAGKQGVTIPVATTVYTNSGDARKYNWAADNRNVTFQSKETAPRFTDVPEGKYFAKPVAWAVENGITSGTSATTFGPSDPCTRAQCVTFLYKADHGSATYSNRFMDVPEGKYYSLPVAWAVDRGITSGVGANVFGPSQTCTRAQIVTFIWKTKGSDDVAPSNVFTDVAADKFYAKAVAWAVENGITSGMSATTFGPGEPCTRGQIVTFLYKAFQE